MERERVGPGARLTGAILLALIALGLLLRVTGLAFNLPHAWEPDGHVLATHVAFIEHGPDYGPHDHFYGRYPQLIARLYALLPRADPAPPGTALEDHLRAAAAPREQLRRFIAVLSVLIVPGTWLLARRFLGRAPALLACGLMAFSVLHIWFAQQTRPHGLSAVFALLAVVAAMRLCERADLAAYAWAGITAILAVCSLQSGIAVLLPLCMAHWLRDRGGTRWANAYLVAVLALLALAFRAYYPFLFESPVNPEDTSGLDVQGLDLLVSGHRIRPADLDGGGFPVVLGAILNYEPILFTLVALGLGTLAFQALTGSRPRSTRNGDDLRTRLWPRRNLVVALSYVVPYLVVLGVYGDTYQRFAIPLLPYLATLGAWALFATAERIAGARHDVGGGAVLGTTLAVVLLASQAAAATKLVLIRRAPDTATLAGRWITEHLEPGRDRILHSPSLDLPIFRTPAALAAYPRDLERTRAWIVYQRQLDPAVSRDRAWDLRPIPMQADEARAALQQDSWAYLSSLGADYALIEHFAGQIRPYNEWLRLGLSRRAQLVARFSPLALDDGDDRPLAYQDDYFERRPVWWWRVLLARAMGPVIEIYRLEPAGPAGDGPAGTR